MRYFGGKQRIAKYIIEVLKEYRKDNQIIVEPFVGGCNIISKLCYGVKHCYDINPYLIEMYKAFQNGWIPPKQISEEQYTYIRNNKNEDMALTGFVGIGCSYSGKWFGGYARDKTGRNYCMNAYNSLMKIVDEIKDIHFECADYKTLRYSNALIYCDPPYQKTTGYSIAPNFNTEEFWDIMRDWSQNNTVIISEYEAPDDFSCIKNIETKLDIRNKNGEKEKRIEKLFIYRQ